MNLIQQFHNSHKTFKITIDIPHFKEVIIMSTNCDDCGYKNNEVKVGGAVSMHGKKITLKVTEKEDLSRDVLKVWGFLRNDTEL